MLLILRKLTVLFHRIVTLVSYVSLEFSFIGLLRWYLAHFVLPSGTGFCHGGPFDIRMKGNWEIGNVSHIQEPNGN